MVKRIELTESLEPPSQRSAAALFAELGQWDGETTDELLAMLAEARRQGGQREVPEL